MTRPAGHRRFRVLAEKLGVTVHEAVATAAARDAANGPDFVRRAEAAWGAPVRVLSGKEEAHFAAQGVIAAIPDADGLAADLGGGSLDMAMVKSGRTGEPCSLPFGPLRLIDLAKGDTIRFDNGTVMNNFNSKILNRTFPSITFVGRVVVGN